VRSREATNTNFIVSGLTRTCRSRPHDLPHSRRARSLLHHRCGSWNM